MKDFQIAVLPGDGVGLEVTREALKVLSAVKRIYDISVGFVECPVGGIAIDEYGEPLPPETFDVVKESSAVLLGAVGGPKWDDLETKIRPEAALLGLRSGLGLFCNLRPVTIFPELLGVSTIKEDVIKGTDILVVRELVGGIYFGTPRGISKKNGERVGTNTLSYKESEIRRIARLAFEVASRRKKRVTSVDKANVLESMALWREVVTGTAKEFPEVKLDHMYVDNCAMQLIRNPGAFDTILTTNLFGDILSDEAAMIAGSIGMLPSASIGEWEGEGRMRKGLYEPVHGSAPDIEGKGLANPIASILSAAMMLEYSFGELGAARAVEGAVKKAISNGFRTKDIFGGKGKEISTQEMGDHIAENLLRMKE